MKDKDERKKTKKNSNFFESLSHAFEGFNHIIKEERNMRFHLIFSLLVILLSVLLPMTIAEWLWVLLVVFLVIIIEIINTTVENLADLVTVDYNILAKKIKDMAAAAVLFTSSFSVVVGLIIFLPKILNVINYLF